MIRIFIPFLLVFILSLKLQAQLINPDFCGQNAWLPGTFSDFTPTPITDPPWDIFDPANCGYCTVNPTHLDKTATYPHGKLDDSWDELKQSGSRMVRVGGTSYNINQHELWDYRWQVERIKEQGMIPVVQVPVGIPTNQIPIAFAESLVTYLNITNASTAYTTYWVIGNEYDHVDIGFTSADCAAKIISFSQALKTIDPTIKIIGPELSTFYDGYSYAEDLISTPGFLSAIDFFSFHIYPQNYTITACSETTCTGNRAAYINFAKIKFNDDKLMGLKALIGNKPIAVTEFNVTGCSKACSDWDINPANGYDARSFIAGQMIADLFLTGMAFNNGQVKFMNMHCVIEGDPDRGFLQVADGLPRSSYYHFQMVAQNFKGKYKNLKYKGMPANVKLFGAESCSTRVVMIMNQNNSGAPLPFSVNPVSQDVVFNYSPSLLPHLYNDLIPNESTMLLVFNRCGKITKRIFYNVADKGPLENTYSPPSCQSIGKNCNAEVLLKCSNQSGHPNSNYSGVINSSQTVSDSAWFYGTVIIPNNVKLTIDNSISIFDETGKIEVLPGGKLYIKDSKLLGCGGKTWEGIFVKGNNNISGQLVIERSLVSDAAVAVKTDKTNEIFITENIFKNGTTAIEMNKNKGFTIKKNQFSNFTYGIKSSKTLVKESLIKENSFVEVKYALYFENDEHTKLDINCNRFIDYTEHAIKSINTNLKDQGNLYSGAGNEFVSASLQVNDKLYHQGNTMKYYYEPSNPISNGMNVQTLQAQGEGCSFYAQRMGGEEMKEDENGIVNSFEKERVFIENRPNPAKNKTTFVFQLPENTRSAEIKILDVLGKPVAIYGIAPDSRFFEADCSKMENGIYFYSLVIDGKSQVIKKIAVTK